MKPVRRVYGLSLLCFLMLLPAAASAQAVSRTAPPKSDLELGRHEIRLGYGTFPVLFHEAAKNNRVLGDSWFTFNGPLRALGMVHLNYGYRVTERFQLAVNASYALALGTVSEILTGERAGTHLADYRMLLPVFRFTWVQRPYLRVYSSFGLGLSVYREELTRTEWKYLGLNTAVQLVPLGIAAGRKWFGFAELGYGSLGVVQAGVGYRF